LRDSIRSAVIRKICCAGAQGGENGQMARRGKNEGCRDRRRHDRRHAACILLRKGLDATRVDPRQPGEGASFGNAGCFNGASAVPLLVPARRLYPALSPAYAEDRRSRWMGHRPSLPDSRPVLAYRAKPAMLLMPSGTATLACAAQTGTSVAEIVAGEMTQLDVAACSPRQLD
jgi:hypothetical protein